jgi:hypothetical protein
MNRVARWALFYVALSIIAAPIWLLASFPRYPSTAIGWLAFLALPIPAVLAGEWLFEYRPVKFLSPLEAWASRMEKSPYRLLIVGLIAAGGAVGLAVMALLS